MTVWPEHDQYLLIESDWIIFACARVDPRFCRCPKTFVFGCSASNSALVSLRHATPEQGRRAYPVLRVRHGRHMATSYRNPPGYHATYDIRHMAYKFCKGTSIVASVHGLWDMGLESSPETDWSAAVMALERTTSIAGWKEQWEHQLRSLQATDWWLWGRTW